MTTLRSDRQQATREAVRAQIEGKRSEPGAVIFRLLLIVMLLASLLILVVLLTDIFAGAWATFRDRGLDFVLSGLSLNPETAGVWTGIIGSLIIAFVVILLAIPILLRLELLRFRGR